MSKAFFRVPSSLNEWVRQQTRSWVRVHHANIWFAGEVRFLQQFFGCYFDIDASMGWTAGKKRGLRRLEALVFGRLHKVATQIVRAKVRYALAQQTLPDWTVAVSTKIGYRAETS
jgi:hypothetical protein